MLDLFRSVQARVSVSVALGIGVVAATFGYFYRKKLLESPPRRWIRVGELTDLMIYPIKSCAGISVKTIQCSVLGLKEREHMRDRVFMITSLEGQGITARSHPKIVKIQPNFIADRMILSAPGQEDIVIDLLKLNRRERGKSVVWGETVTTIDCGDDVAAWISKFLLNDDTGFRLVYYPDDFPTRDAWSKKKDKRELETHAGALHDVTSYMLMNQASIDDLNTKLTERVTSRQFRPNFLVKGPNAYLEDKWEWIKIGNVIFRNIMLCGRCILVNINPETGTRNPDFEPLKTLKSYRVTSENVKDPILGIHLGIHTSGTILLGDPVYIGATQETP
ncbi:mitochondrial amidoxime reducing component 2-like [Phlebotomus argentipes]|uniref:mitochondrial amidoxime reducing component 2-like n=1 Tax=Phlebotomus argentipes TaxID=94469 RepID=UPI002893707F|nr:mitochondrial amidoxime reducing component 2-like [Phlebotomus argentipes]